MSVASVGYNLPVSIPIETQRSQPQVVRQPDVPVDAPANNEPRKPADVQSTTAALEQIGQAFNKKLQFVVDQNSDQVIVKVIDRDTDKVIKELPPEELQRLNNNLQDAIGFLFNEFV